VRRAASRWLGAATCALLVAAGAACRRAQPAVVYDLVELARVAELGSPWQVVRLGSAEAEAVQESGFQKGGGLGRYGVWALLQPTAALRIALPSVAERRLLFAVEPEPGTVGRELSLLWHGQAVARWRLRAGRQLLSAEIPAAVQRTGRQRLRFFLDGETPTGAERRQAPPIARVHALALGEAADATLRELPDTGAWGPLVGVESPRGPALLQAGPSTLRLGVFVPEDAELAFTPALPPNAKPGSAARASVRLETHGATRELWSASLTPGAGREVRLRLGARAGEPAAIVLEVAPQQGGAPLVAWERARLLGTRASAPLQPEPKAADRAGALRERLRGTNVVVVVLDAGRARQFGAYGYREPTTPHIDRIAGEGVVFERHYTQAVYTYSAMSAVWSGQYPDHAVGKWRPDGRLPQDRLTLAELLAAHGVYTSAFAANPNAGPGYGLDRGFAEFHKLYKEPWYRTSADVFREAVFPWLERGPRQPFLLYLHYLEPHMPLRAPPLGDVPITIPEEARSYRWWSDGLEGAHAIAPAHWRELRALYDGNLAFVDSELGALRERLERLGLWDRSLVVITADHGEELAEHGMVGHNVQLFEESTHVPLIVRFPPSAGVRPRRIAELTSHIDLAPTLADVHGLLGRGGSDRAFQGRSLLNLVEGAPGASAVVTRAVGHQPTYALVTPRYKLIHDVVERTSRLYDLEADPEERHDLSAAEPLRVLALRQALEGWLLRLRAGAISGLEPARIDASERETLRALGYVQ
jgi:arylsulfatase A-like enzyme